MKNKTGGRTIHLHGVNKKLLAINAIFLTVFFFTQFVTMSTIGVKSGEIQDVRKESENKRQSIKILKAQVDESKSLEEIEAIREKVKLKEKTVRYIEPVTENLAVSN